MLSDFAKCLSDDVLCFCVCRPETNNKKKQKQARCWEMGGKSRDTKVLDHSKPLDDTNGPTVNGDDLVGEREVSSHISCTSVLILGLI